MEVCCDVWRLIKQNWIPWPGWYFFLKEISKKKMEKRTWDLTHHWISALKVTSLPRHVTQGRDEKEPMVVSPISDIQALLTSLGVAQSGFSRTISNWRVILFVEYCLEIWCVSHTGQKTLKDSQDCWLILAWFSAKSQYSDFQLRNMGGFNTTFWRLYLYNMSAETSER